MSQHEPDPHKGPRPRPRPFHSVRTRFIRQDDARWTKKWFQSDNGDVFVWLNPEGQVARFQLSLGADAGDMVDWSLNGPLRTGRVRGRSGPWTQESPTIDYDRKPAPKVLADALEYLQWAAGGLPLEFRRAIVGAIQQAAGTGDDGSGTAPPV